MKRCMLHQKDQRKEENNMATNKAGRGTKTCGINFPIAEARELERRARSMKLSTGAYIKVIVRNHLSSGDKVVITEGQYES